MAGLLTGGGTRPGFADKASGLLAQAGQTFSQQDRVATTKEPGKTAGGAGMAALSGAAAGTMINPGWGTAIGAVVGVGAYMLG
jgi:hypothetical protein